jgi:hippurate hydrolase
VSYRRNYLVLVHSEPETAISGAAASAVVGRAHVDAAATFTNGSEDVACMLQAPPVCYVALGAGAGPFLHDLHYDFNNQPLSTGARYGVELAIRLPGRA